MAICEAHVKVFMYLILIKEKEKKAAQNTSQRYWINV